jgi:hypothetical protein
VTVNDAAQFKEFIGQLGRGMRGQAWFVGGVMADGEIVSGSNLPKDKQVKLLKLLLKSFEDGTEWAEDVAITLKPRQEQP